MSVHDIDLVRLYEVPVRHYSHSGSELEMHKQINVRSPVCGIKRISRRALLAHLNAVAEGNSQALASGILWTDTKYSK
jgi:hypothetical protein